MPILDADLQICACLNRLNHRPRVGRLSVGVSGLGDGVF